MTGCLNELSSLATITQVKIYSSTNLRVAVTAILLYVYYKVQIRGKIWRFAVNLRWTYGKIAVTASRRAIIWILAWVTAFNASSKCSDFDFKVLPWLKIMKRPNKFMKAIKVLVQIIFIVYGTYTLAHCMRTIQYRWSFDCLNVPGMRNVYLQCRRYAMKSTRQSWNDICWPT